MTRDIPNRRPCINTRTENFHFSVGFDPYTGHPVEFFITGRGKVGQQLDTELYELSGAGLSPRVHRHPPSVGLALLTDSLINWVL